MSPRDATPTKRARRRAVAHDARVAAYRELVLEAAEESFAERGVEATKMEEIGEQAGLSLGTIYSVFDGGKAAIVDALHEKRMRELLERSIVAAEGLDDPLEMLIVGMRAYVEYFLGHPDYLRIELNEAVSWGLPQRGGSMRARTWKEGHAMQERLFKRGIEAGIFYADDPGRLARTLAAMQQVRLFDWVTDGMGEDPELIIAGLELSLRRAFCRRASDRKDDEGSAA